MTPKKHTFGEVIEILKEGGIGWRESWGRERLFFRKKGLKRKSITKDPTSFWMLDARQKYADDPHAEGLLTFLEGEENLVAYWGPQTDDLMATDWRVISAEEKGYLDYKLKMKDAISKGEEFMSLLDELEADTVKLGNNFLENKLKEDPLLVTLSADLFKTLVRL